MFDWDSANLAHIARHNISPEAAEQVIHNNPLDIERQIRNGEERILHLGETLAGHVLFVVVTQRAGRYRVVTAFPANRASRLFYASQKAERNAEDRNP